MLTVGVCVLWMGVRGLKIFSLAVAATISEFHLESAQLKSSAKLWNVVPTATVPNPIVPTATIPNPKVFNEKLLRRRTQIAFHDLKTYSLQCTKSVHLQSQRFSFAVTEQLSFVVVLSETYG